MAKSANTNFVGEILHFTATRMRVLGNGNLRLFLRSMSNINNQRLTDIPMSLATNIEPTVLANFNDQRGQLELNTVLINEVFTISKIVIFIRPVATGYPQ